MELRTNTRQRMDRAARIKRRLAVRFTHAASTMQYSGYTTDISETGVFIQTLRPPRLGTELDLGLVLRGGREVRVRAVVARLVVPPPQFQRMLPSGFGARFLVAGLSLSELEHSAPALERQR